jgi:hypothetical protein
VLVIEQLNTNPLSFAMDAVGSVLSRVVVALAVEVQPFEPVTVTVNVPAVVTLVAAVVAPFDHK